MTTSARRRRRANLPILPRYTLTLAGYRVTDRYVLQEMPMAADSEFSQINLLLETALLTLARDGYTVSAAADEVIERMPVVSANVRRRMNLEEEMRAARR